MFQFVSQDLFDRMALALIINTDPQMADGRSADEVSRFLRDVRDAFPADPFTEELFQAARWLGAWSREHFGPEPERSFEALGMIYARCENFYPSGGKRPLYTSDTQPLPPQSGGRLANFKANISSYVTQLAA